MLDWVPKWLRWAFAAVVVVAVVAIFVVPRLSEADDAWSAARDIAPHLLVAATAAQAAAIACQAELTRFVLPPQSRLPFTDMVRVEFATMAVSHTVPGGTAAGTALAYRLMTEGASVPGGHAGFALGVRGIGSALVLNVILWVALMVSIPAHGFDPLYTTAAVLGTLLFGATTVVGFLLVRREGPTRRWIARVAGRLPFLDEEAVRRAIGRVADQLRTLVTDPRVAMVAVGWSAGYWLLSAASLWVFLYAFGHRAEVVSLLVAFGIVNVLAAIPVTPRGLGIVEGALIPMLVGFGAPTAAATLAVIAWRLVSFWAPIPVGALTYVSLRFVGPRSPQDREEREEAMKQAVDEVRDHAESLREWGERHGVVSRR